MPLFKPRTVAEFVTTQQKALDDGRLLVLDPVTELEFTAPVEFTLRGGFSYAHGLDANGARFHWRSDGNWERTMLTYRTSGAENHYFTLRGLSINGDQSGGSLASPLALLRLEARSGAAIRGAQVDYFTAEWCQNGIWIEGEVFESYVNAPRLSWCRNAGVVCRHGYPEIPGVLSNVYITRPNITRAPANMGAAMGIFCDRANSVLIDNGNFISLDGPAIKATNGVKRVTNCDFENTGNTDGAAIVIDRSDYWSQVVLCEGSNTQGHMKLLIKHGGDRANLDVALCRMYEGTVIEDDAHGR